MERLIIAALLIVAAIAVAWLIQRRRGAHGAAVPRSELPSAVDLGAVGIAVGPALVVFTEETCRTCAAALAVVRGPAGAGLPVAEVSFGNDRELHRRHGIDTENFVRCGALTIDLANYRVTVAGESVVLTFKEYELLRYLAMNAGRVSTREQLLNRVWGYDYFGGARTVDVHIRRIRSKIEIHGNTFIETVRNVGYRLVASG